MADDVAFPVSAAFREAIGNVSTGSRDSVAAVDALVNRVVRAASFAILSLETELVALRTQVHALGSSDDEYDSDDEDWGDEDPAHWST